MASLLDPRPDHTAQARRLLCSPDAYATTLLVWALDRLGLDEETGQPGAFAWGPETIKLEAEAALGVPLPGPNFDKLMAAVTVLTTDLFFKDVASFVQLANALCGDELRPDVWSPADSLECAWAITEALLLSPPDDEEADTYFSTEVRSYITEVLKDEGYVTAPDVLKIAVGADFSAQVSYDYGDDPELFGAIQKMQQGKATDVEAVIAEGLVELLGQLEELPLRRRSKDKLRQHAQGLLRRAAAQLQKDS